VLWATRPPGSAPFAQGPLPRPLLRTPRRHAPAHRHLPGGTRARITSFLELNPGTYRLAPPILVTSQTPRRRMQLELLERTWDLPASEALGVKR
jgi:hypothetical protein